jgi:hypothetical protein
MGFTWYLGSERVSDGLTHGLNRGCTASAPYVCSTAVEPLEWNRGNRLNFVSRWNIVDNLSTS